MNALPPAQAVSPPRSYHKRHFGDLEADWQRTTALYLAGCGATSFRAPRPISRYVETNSIEYEHLPIGCTLRQKINRMALLPTRIRLANTASLVTNTGVALEELQRRLLVHEARPLRLVLPPIAGLNAGLIAHAQEQINSAPLVPIHGDFWQGNVWVSNSGLMIFDPLPNPHSPDPSATLGSTYYDASYMIFSLWAVYPSWVIPLQQLAWVRTLCLHFLTGYESAALGTLERTTVHVLALYWLDRYLQVMPARLNSAVTALRRLLIERVRRRLLKEIHRWTTIEKVTLPKTTV